jgi:PAS domain S-box-containing protein
MSADLPPILGLADILAQSPCAIAVLDQTLRYHWMSDRWQVDYGLDAASVGQPYDRSNPVPKSWPAALQQALTGTPQQGCDRHPLPTGETVAMQWTITPWRTADTISGVIIHSQQQPDLTPSPVSHPQTPEDIPEDINDVAWAEIFNLSPNLICLVDADGRFLHLNRAWEITLGWSVEQLHLAPVIDWIHPDDVPSTLEIMQKVNQGEICVSFENRYRRQDGSYCWLAWTAARIESQGCIYGLARDVSDRKKTQTAINAQQELLQNIIDTTPQWLVVKDNHGRFVVVNQAMAKAWGTTPDQLIGQCDADLIANPAEVAKIRADDQWVLQTRHDKIIPEESLTDAAGNVRWVRTSKHPLKLSNQTDPYLLVSIYDITDRKQSEEALRQSEQRYQVLAETAPVGIFHSDAAGRCTYVNQQICILMGLNFTAIQGQHWMAVIHPQDRDRVANEWSRAQVENQCFQSEYRFLRPDQSVRWVYTQVQTIVDAEQDDQITGYVGTCTDVTERKLAEAELQRYKQAVDSASDAISLTDLIGRVIYVNDAFQALYDCDDLEQLRQQGGLMGLFTDAGLMDEIITAATAGRGWSCEIEQRSLTGRPLQVALRANPIRSNQDQIVGLVVIATDIHDRKEAEAALQASEATNQAILKAIPDLMFRLSDDGVFLDYIPPDSFRDILSADCERTGRNIIDVVPADLAQRNLYYAKRAIATQTLQVYEQTVNIDGETQFEEVRVVPIEADQTLFIVRDISDRKRIEASLLDFAQRLQSQVQREQFLNRLSAQIRSSLEQPAEAIIQQAIEAIRNILAIDRVHFAWYITNVETPYWDVIAESREAEMPDFKGIYPADQVGPMAEILLRLEIICEDDVSAIPDPIYRQLVESLNYRSVLVVPLEVQSGIIGVLVCSHSQEIRHWHDTEIDLVKSAINQLAIATNQALLYAQSRASNEELRQTLEELNRTQSQLIQTEKMSSLGQLVAGVAHEINNPVNFIYGNIDHARDYINDLLQLIALYQQYYPDPQLIIADHIDDIDLPFLLDDLPKMLQSMRVGAERIKEIVASLRTFSRMDESEMKAVDIHDGIESTLMILHNRLKSKPHSAGIEVIRDYGDLPKVECYAGQLNQVFMNILSNAIDALLDQSDDNQAPTITIQTRLHPAVNQVEIRIQDNGTGIDPNHISRLFNPFFTTKEIGKGTGLGLSISYQIITEKHGGTLHCESDLGSGTCFIIVIPLQQTLQPVRQSR